LLTSAQKKELQDLVASGGKILAVKRYREITGVGLQEALHAVEHLGAAAGSGLAEAGARVKALITDPGALRQAEAAAMAALREGNAIEAIQRYRGYTNAGMKEAKEAIDALSVVHRSDGRIDPKLARALIADVAAGRKEEAIVRLISSKGYDESEARAIIARLGSMNIGGQSCFGGCLRVIVAFVVIVIVFVALAVLLPKS
jgi:ribosomal protein L7/L12